MKFTKMHGIGNDYIYIDCTKKPLENPESVAVKLSDRHFGIGGDGIVLIEPSDKADFFMSMYNADGSRAEMCGNAIRCVGKYVYDNGLTDKTEIAIDTLAGIKYLTLNVKDESVETVKVNMGAPILKGTDIPVAIDKDTVINESITVEGKEYKITCVSMGNPHAVVYVDSPKNLDLEKIGPCFENHPVFPRRVNTEFVEVVDRHNLNMRVWERGSGETLACGTGACASLVATVLNGLCDDSATLHLLGGDLLITWDRNENVVYMEGPATKVFEGEI